MKSSFLTLLCMLGLVMIANGQNLIPLPVRAERTEGQFLIDRNTAIYNADFPDLTDYLNDHIERLCRYRLPSGNTPEKSRIVFEKGEGPAEGYTLTVTPHRITIRGNDRGGAFYALQTLFQLMPNDVYRTDGSAAARETYGIPSYTIEDAPRFAYRGIMLDVSRTFFDKNTVLQYIDWLSRHKINTLHWHLTDDNGWRIEIKKYPELTEKGAWRGPGEVLPPSYGSGNKRYGGFYTQEEIREIVRYAAFRNIEIIPEIDLPGHSQTLTSVFPETFCQSETSYPDEEMRNVICTAREENYDLLRDIFSEIANLFPSKYIHIGGDEVSLKYWRNCSRCQALMKRKQMQSARELQHYFTQRMERIIDSLGKKCAVWDEALSCPGLEDSTLLFGWEHTEACEEVAAAGRPLVMMPGTYCYIDMKQHAQDRGHTWAGLVDTRRLYDFRPEKFIPAENRQWIRGVEAAQWSELMMHPAHFLEYQGYPRICALAEIGWTPAERRNWRDFDRRLHRTHMARLGSMGIRFRMTPPEVKYEHGVISVSSTAEEVRYTTDLQRPDETSPLYTEPIRTNHPERYLFRAFSDGGWSTAITPTVHAAQVELPAGTQKTVTLPLNEYINRDGIWLLAFTQEQDKTKISRLEINGPDTAYVIIRNGQKINPFYDIRLYIDSLNRNATMSLTLKNEGDETDKLQVLLKPSCYIEPPVRVTSSIECQSKYPVSRTANYKFNSYARSSRPCRADDYILFTFESPVACEAIDIRTGLPDITRYSVTNGTVSWSYNGRDFTEEIPLDDDGLALIRPERPVKAVRITILGSNGETTLCWQNLRIIPKCDEI